MNSKLEISWNARKLSLLLIVLFTWLQKMFFLLLTHILEKQQHFESQESLCLKKVLRRIVTALTQLINETKVETLVILGDFFHARLARPTRFTKSSSNGERYSKN